MRGQVSIGWLVIVALLVVILLVLLGKLSSTRPVNWVLGLVLLVVVGLSFFVGYNLADQANQNNDNCKAILTLSRNLFSTLPAPAQDMDPSGALTPEERAYVRERIRIYVQEELGSLYYHQYSHINEAFDLEDRCGGSLPRGTPPPPTP